MLTFVWYLTALTLLFAVGCAWAAIPADRQAWAELREEYLDRIARDAADIARLHEDMCAPGENLYMLTVWRRNGATRAQALLELLSLHALCRRQRGRMALVAFINRYAVARTPR